MLIAAFRLRLQHKTTVETDICPYTEVFVLTLFMTDTAYLASLVGIDVA
jgi:hypothetical protein